MPYIIDRSNIIPVNIDTKYDSKPLPYPGHDLMSIFTHWDDELKRNIPTENKLNGGVNNNAENSK